MTLRLLLMLAAVVASGACAARAPIAPPAGDPIVVFMSDFGTVDDSVALCKGVMLDIAPRLRIVDITHDVTPYSIRDGARFLAGTAPYYPASAVFVAVVDPGVGSTRKPIVARSKRGQLFVVPDNGLLTLMAETDGITEVREITASGWMRGAALSSTFHGRDIFAPVAAHLARGGAFEDVGPPLASWVRLELVPARADAHGIVGEIVGLDGPYGNLVSNVDADLFARLGYALGDAVPVEIGHTRLTLPFVRTFSDVPEGRPLIFVDSRGRMGLAVNLGNFAKVHGVVPPAPLRIGGKR